LKSTFLRSVFFVFWILLALQLEACSHSRQGIMDDPQHIPGPFIVRKPEPKPKHRPRPKPEPPPIEVMMPQPFKKPVIVIDPGHGGEDFGTHSLTPPKYHEKYLNLATAKVLRGYLEQLGYHAILTRSEDVFISLDKRAQLANGKKPVLFVSVHYNSAPSEEAHGVEVYYYQNEEDQQRSNQSKTLAQHALIQILANTKAKSRGVKHGNFAVIRNTKMPAILIEGGFLTNAGEMQKIKNPDYVKKLAWGIAKGIQDYMNKNILTKVP